MTLDRHAAERQRFARLLGLHGEVGSGLPVRTEPRLDRPVATEADEASDTSDRQS